MKKKKKSGWLSSLLIVLVFFAGLSLMLYPKVSDYWNSLHQSQVIVDYNNSVSTIDPEVHDAKLMEAMAYNASLASRDNPFLLTEEQRAVYRDMLQLTEEPSPMAYIEIPSIGVSLPIYHGTEESTLKKAVGHMEWTSLPVGGESTHCAISGHRGLPSSELLTNIDHMEKGDVFYIHVLGDTLKYRVDKISVVLPDEMDEVLISESKDYVTLVTCTPYGINSHRLLVRGARVMENAPTVEAVDIAGEVEFINSAYPAAALLIAGLTVSVLVMAFTGRKVPQKETDEKEARDEQSEDKSE